MKNRTHSKDKMFCQDNWHLQICFLRFAIDRKA